MFLPIPLSILPWLVKQRDESAAHVRQSFKWVPASPSGDGERAEALEFYFILLILAQLMGCKWQA